MGLDRWFFWGLGERGGDGVRGKYCTPPKLICEMGKRKRKRRHYD